MWIHPLIVAVAVFFFIYVGDPKHLLSQTQKFNNVFLWKTKKGRFSERKTLWKPPWNSVPPVRFRAVGRNRRLASFYFCLKSNFEKVRKTAKNEENPRKSRVFRPASFKTGTLEYKLLKRYCIYDKPGFIKCISSRDKYHFLFCFYILNCLFRNSRIREA